MDPRFAQQAQRYVQRVLTIEQSKRLGSREDRTSSEEADTENPFDDSTQSESNSESDPEITQPQMKRIKTNDSFGDRAIAVSNEAARTRFNVANHVAPQVAVASEEENSVHDAQQDYVSTVYGAVLASELIGSAASLLQPPSNPSTPRKSNSTFTLPTTPASKSNRMLQSFNTRSSSTSEKYAFHASTTSDLVSVSPTPYLSPRMARSPAANYSITPKRAPRSQMPTLSSPTPTKSGGAQGRRRSLFIPSKTSSPSFSLSTQYQQSISPFSSCPETKRILEYSVAFQPRSISKAPFKVLDAPELQDDFYLNLVDWSYSNVLGVGLGSCVYLWDAQNSRVTKLCDLKDPTQNAVNAAGGDTVTCVNWNPKGNLAAIGTNKGVVQIWDVRAEKKIRELRGHDSRVGAIAWSAQDLLTTGSRDRNIFFRDIRLPSTDSITDKLHSHRQEVCGLKWASAPSNDNLLASGGNDNKLLIWDRAMLSKPLHTLVEHTAAVKAIAWSPYKAGLLASGGGTADQKIRFWNTSASPREATGGGTADSLSNVNTNSQVCNIAWSRSEDEIVSTHGFSQNQVVVWKVSATGQDALAPQLHTLATLTGHTMRVLYLAVSPDNENIVTGAGDETLRFWSVFGKKKKSDISGSWMENGPLVR